MGLFRLPVFVFLMALAACRPEAETLPGSEAERQLQALFEQVQEGQIIEIPEGYYRMSRPLLFNRSRNVSIRGKGAGKTILDFSGMKEGKTALSIAAEGAVLEDFSVFNPQGACISVQNAGNIVLRRLRLGSDSTNSPGMSSGGCRILKTNSLLIEQVEVRGSLQAGILLQESRSTVLRNNNLHNNAAGIEVRNCFDTELLGNNCENNTVGILLSNLPDLVPANGSRCRIYNNRIIGNNAPNLRKGGNLLSAIPSGMGIFVLAGREIEIFGNEISGQQSMSVAILNYDAMGKSFDNRDYDGHSGGIYFHDNRIQRGNTKPDTSTDLGKRMFEATSLNPVDLLIDATGTSSVPEKRICVRNNGEMGLACMDLSERAPRIATGAQNFDCSLPSLQEIRLNTP